MKPRLDNPKLKQGFLRNIKLSANLTRHFLNLWPPYVGAGIHVEKITADYREARVRMRQRMTNTNIFGTHFGGSLYAMTDPFYALLVLHNLGPDYVVWDKAAQVHFKLPGRGTVRAHFVLTEAMLADIRTHTADGQKYEPCYSVNIVDSHGEIVASVDKTLYIRRHPHAEPTP